MDIVPPKALKLSQLCRLCLSEEGLMVHIYGEEKTGFTVPLRDRIMTCASVEVQEEDGLPALVCHRCLFHVDLLFEFKERCKRADKALRCFCDDLSRKGETNDIVPITPKERKPRSKKAKQRKSGKTDSEKPAVSVEWNNEQAVSISMKAKTGGAGPSAKPYNCPHCNKPFTYKARLAAHIKTHGEGALYHADNLHQPPQQHHQPQPPQQQPQPQPPQQPPQQYDRMQYDMQSYSCVQSYPEAPTTPATPPSSSSDSSYSCTNCNASFMTPWMLADHVRSHCCDTGASYSCDKCFMQFSSYSELEQHASTHNCDSQSNYYDAYTPPPSHYGMYMQQQQQHIQQQQQHMQQQQRQLQQQYQQQADYGGGGDVGDNGRVGSPWGLGECMGGVQRRPDGYESFSRPTMGSMEELEKFALGSTMVTSPLEPLTSPVPTEPPPSAPSPIDAENSMQSVQSVQSVQSAQSAHSTHSAHSSGSAPGSSSCSVVAAKLNHTTSNFGSGGMISHPTNFANNSFGNNGSGNAANATFTGHGNYGMGSNFGGNFSGDASPNFGGSNQQMFCNNSGSYAGGSNAGFGVGASHNFGGNANVNFNSGSPGNFPSNNNGPFNANAMFGAGNKSSFANCPSPGFGNNASYGNANNNYTSNNNAHFGGNTNFGSNTNTCFGNSMSSNFGNNNNASFSGPVNTNFEGNAAAGNFGNSNPNFGVVTGGNFSGNSGANPKSVNSNFQSSTSNDFGNAYEGNTSSGAALLDTAGSTLKTALGGRKAVSPFCGDVGENCKVSTPPDYSWVSRKSDDQQPYSCHVCDAGFASRTLFTNHMKTHANERPMIKFQAPGAHGRSLLHPTEEGCDVKQEGDESADEPKRDDEAGGSDAEVSSQESGDEGDLDSSPSKRSKKTDQDGKNHECPYCGKGFINTVRLNNHMKIHTVDKPFKCDQCEKSFRSRAHLQRHAKTHVGEKPFKCDTCNKSFTVSMNLKIHVRTHTGERPYSCNLCKMAFIGYSHLYNHLKTHTSDTPFTYTYFNKTYTTAGNFSSAKKASDDSAVNASPMDSELQAELEAGVEDEDTVLD